MKAGLIVLCAVVASDAEQQTFRTRHGATVAHAPVSPGVHAGAVARGDLEQLTQPAAARTWVKQTLDATAQKACLKDIHMSSLMATDVYVVGEGGIVLKANVSQGNVGVEQFKTILDAKFPNYYYGVTSNTDGGVMVTGFVDGVGPSGPISNGVARTSYDGGATWNDPMVVDDKTWVGGPIRCTNASHCVFPGVSSPKMYVTENGILSIVDDFKTVVPDAAKAGWFAGPFEAHGPTVGKPNLASSVVATGIGLCNSSLADLSTWNCTHSVDDTFDGGIALLVSSTKTGPITYAAGLVGGGEISAPMSGWIHQTQDEALGKWTKRTLSAPFPIRWVGFFAGVAFAAGGDYNTGVGGIYSSGDMGKTWGPLEIDTGVEMSACSGTARDFGHDGRAQGGSSGGSMIVTCVGSARGKASVIVSTILEIGKYQL